MIFWTLVLAADIVTGFTDLEKKKRRRKDVVGNV